MTFVYFALLFWLFLICFGILILVFFKKKKPKRLYYPTKSKWYTRPKRRKFAVKRPKRIMKTSLKKLFKTSPYFIVAIGLFIIFFIFLISSSYLAIKNIQVIRENLNTDSASIEKELHQYIGKNTVFFPKSRIKKTIQEKFPEFASVKINKTLPSTISISLKSHANVANLKAYYILPVADIVEDEEEEKKSISPFKDKAVTSKVFSLKPTKASAKKDEPKPVEQKSLLNSIGQAIFDREENLELITVIVKNLDQPVADRQQIVAKGHMDYMFNTIKYFKNIMDITIVEVEYISNGWEIHLKTKKNLILWVSMERDYKKQIEQFNSIYKAAELDKENLSYIDLRIRNKIIYCSKGSRCDK